MDIQILRGDVRKVLPTLPSDYFDCIVTSPPYWSLRDYGHPDQIGMEPTMQEFVDTMVEIGKELRRVLKPEGTMWFNIGDTYAGDMGGTPMPPETLAKSKVRPEATRGTASGYCPSHDIKAHGLGNKNLCMIPNRVAIAMQDDGWIIRSEIIWHKPNPMPESVKDRPTRAHEKVWLMTKSEKYFYDADAIREPISPIMLKQIKEGYNGEDTKEYNEGGAQSASGTKKRIIENAQKRIEAGEDPRGANAQNVWSIKKRSFADAHFATMPKELAEKCIKAGCPVGGRVLDPFGGAGTTGAAANVLGRNATLIELNDEYAAMAEKRFCSNLMEHLI
jgi:DNA modification methylase